MNLASLLWWRIPQRVPTPAAPPAAARERLTTTIGGFGRMLAKSCTTCREVWTLHHRCLEGFWVCCDD